jgi:outer membrane protein OmpA-like peptidoglycan-associated protein
MKAGNVTVSADELGKGLAAEGKIALYGVYFDTGKAELKPESKTQLDEMGKLLNQNKLLKVVIVGHTDNQGSMDANAALSQKRAEAVVAALSGGYKIDAKRLLARGVASLAPVASNGSEAGRARNRRVELVEQ